MKTLIRLKIEKFIENKEEYFVATSDDLEGLVAEGKTIEEVIKIAQDVAKILLELEQETTNKNIIKDIPPVFEYPLFMEV
ncbi:type II toxin-antitoxin system HicB family antitoxin [Geminocystis sp. CENA526]|uniref:type II toxin-antitoxin system HicB family antitoxin n=1 Tax=Geminocystis sp. CENA526 TaxID=1355871 RepID=UPI003D6E4C22